MEEGPPPGAPTAVRRATDWGGMVVGTTDGALDALGLHARVEVSNDLGKKTVIVRAPNEAARGERGGKGAVESFEWNACRCRLSARRRVQWGSSSFTVGHEAATRNSRAKAGAGRTMGAGVAG